MTETAQGPSSTQVLLGRLRHPMHPVNQALAEQSTLGQRVADRMSNGIGSWWFVISQAVFTVAWLVANTVNGWDHWDHYPFVLLNLVYSFQAGFTGPILLLAGNRQAARDRLMSEHDFATNQRAEALVERILNELLTNSETTLAIARHLGAHLEHQNRLEAADGGGAGPTGAQPA